MDRKIQLRDRSTDGGASRIFWTIAFLRSSCSDVRPVQRQRATKNRMQPRWIDKTPFPGIIQVRLSVVERRREI